MTTFDVSTGRANTGPVPASPVPAELDEDGPMGQIPALDSMLDQLHEQLDAREIDNTVTVDVPGMGLRLVCQIDFPYNKYAAWQKASFPRNQRNGRKTNPLDMDRAALSTFVLLNTCVGMEYRTSGGDWLAMTKPDGSALRPDSTEFLARFNQVDARSFLRKLFGGDAGMMRAGEHVIEEAGWSEAQMVGGEDEDDPLD